MNRFLLVAGLTALLAGCSSPVKLDSVPVVFGSTVHMPWFKWLDMGDRPGHLVWHAGGAKLKSIDELPVEYRRRAEREYPALLTADPAKSAERVMAPKKAP